MEADIPADDLPWVFPPPAGGTGGSPWNQTPLRPHSTARLKLQGLGRSGLPDRHAPAGPAN